VLRRRREIEHFGPKMQICILVGGGIAVIPAGEMLALRRSLWLDSLSDAFRGLWPIHSPSTPLLWGRHLDVLFAHLQAQLEGWARRQRDPAFLQAIQNMLATLPPGSLKSRALVGAQAWAWARWPSLTMLALSGNPRISIRDGMLFRQVVTSPVYREIFRPAWTIRDDQDAKGSLGNTAGGVRMAMGWGANAIGEHVDWIIVDDPHDPEQVEGEASRLGVHDRWDSAWANRVNDLASSIRTGIAQRTHEDDWSARRLSEGYVHVDMPMLYESDRACATPLGRVDWRTQEGECLHPDRFPPDVIAKERARVGERRWACLYQGRPAPAGGAIVKLDHLRFWRHDAAPHVAARPKGCYTGPARVLPRDFDQVVIFGDLAGGKLTSKGDFNALVVMARAGADFYLLEFWVKRAAFPEVQAKVRQLAERYPDARIVIEAAAAGQSLVASLQHEISGLVGQTATGDKEARLESVLRLFEAGNVHLPDGAPGLDALIASLTTFPNAAHDDDVDAISGALGVLASGARTEWPRYDLILARMRGQAPPEDEEPETHDHSAVPRPVSRDAAAAERARYRQEVTRVTASIDAARRAQAAREEAQRQRMAERKHKERTR
jgi:predicted phage terminase large subunit-like protein